MNNKALIWRIFLRNKFVEVMNVVLYGTGVVSFGVLFFMGVLQFEQWKHYDLASDIVMCFVVIPFSAVFVVAILFAIYFSISEWIKENWYRAEYEARIEQERSKG